MRNFFAKLGSVSLGVSAVIGLILIWFPMDPPLMPPTIKGLIHISVVLIMSLFIVIALSLFGKAFKHMTNLVWLSKYSYSISIILFTAASITGLFALVHDSSLVGLTEKLPIGAFLSWILLVAIGILKSDKRIKYYLINSR